MESASSYIKLYEEMFESTHRDRLAVAKSPFHSLTRILANKRRKLALTPVNDSPIA
jgi:hypothetical protein